MQQIAGATAPSSRSARAFPRRFHAFLFCVAVVMCLFYVDAQSKSSTSASRGENPTRSATRAQRSKATGKTKRSSSTSSQTSASPFGAQFVPMTRGSWMDEGASMRGSLSQWEQSATYSFMENATLRIRLDPLHSTMQPYLIRQFGQSSEAQAVHEVAEQTLKYLQDYATPLRPLFWAWSDLRVYVRGADVQQLRFSYARTPGYVCQGLQYLAEASNQLTEYVAPTVVSALQTVLHGMAWALCENCWNGCPLECEPTGSTDQLCILKLSPYHAPSLSVTSPIKPFLATTPPVFSFSVTFYTYLSSLYVQNFFVGLVLFYSAHRLSRSRAFHYFLGAAIGITFSVVLALYFVSRQTKSASRMVPGMQFLQGIGSMVSFLAPVTVYVVLPQIYKFIGWSLGYLSDFWAADEVLGIPYLGKIYFLSFGLVGFFLVWWNQWGASPKSQEQQDEEEIEEIGYLDEELPLTTSQSALARLLQLMGLMLLFESTSSTESSLLVVLLVMLTGLFEYLGTTMYFWYHYEAPGRHTTLITKKEFEKQGQSETEKALKQLQAYLLTNPDELERVKEDNEIRLRRFAKGRDHMDASSRDPLALKKPKKSSWSFCAVQ